jgi:hypothetical protein
MKTLEKKDEQLQIMEKRIYPRMNCSLDTQLTAFTYQWPCKIVDISEVGFGVVLTMNLSRGVIVHLADPMVNARVVWSRHNRAGLEIIN